MMAHCVSLVAEGVFEEFPTLKFAFIEGGVCWAPYVMGRLDRMYPALKAEVPYLKRLPSEYLLNNCYFSTQPIEEPDNHQHLLQMLEMMRAEKTVVFASDYPALGLRQPADGLHLLPGRPEAPHLRRERAGDVRPAPARAELERDDGAPTHAALDDRRDPVSLRAIDVDLHHQITDWQAVAPYAPEGLRHRIARAGRAAAGAPRLQARRTPRRGPRPLSRRAAGDPAADPAWVKAHTSIQRGVDIAILTGTADQPRRPAEPRHGRHDRHAASTTGRSRPGCARSTASRARSWSRSRTRRRRSRRSTASATIRAWSRC